MRDPDVPPQESGIHPTSTPPPHTTALPKQPWENADQEVSFPADSWESSFSILQTNFVLVSCDVLPSGGWEFLNQKPLALNHSQPEFNSSDGSQTRAYGNNTTAICKILPGLSHLENS